MIGVWRYELYAEEKNWKESIPRTTVIRVLEYSVDDKSIIENATSVANHRFIVIASPFIFFSSSVVSDTIPTNIQPSKDSVKRKFSQREQTAERRFCRAKFSWVKML